MFLGFASFITSSVLIYQSESVRSEPYPQFHGVKFYDTLFIFSAVAAIFSYKVLESNAERSRFRPIIYGLFIYTLIFSPHNVYVTYTHFIGTLGQSSSKESIKLAIGESIGFFGFFCVMIPLSADSRQGYILNKISLFVMFLLTVSGAILLLRDKQQDESLGETILHLIMPSVTMTCLIFCGVGRSSIEAIYCALFLFGVECVWMPAQLLLLLSTTDSVSTLALIGGILSIVGSVVGLICALWQVHLQYKNAKVSIDAIVIDFLIILRISHLIILRVIFLLIHAIFYLSIGR